MNTSKHLFLLLIVLLTACEAFVGGSGVVKDENGNPLSEAQLLLKIRGNTLDTIFYIDSLGQYQIRQWVGCLPQCPTAEIRFFKKGYGSNIIDGMPSINDTVVILKRNIQ